MAQFFSIHPENPQARLIKQAADIIRKGGLIVYPTDSCYALGCRLDDKDALERIRRIRQLDDKHYFTLVCHNLSQLGTYARVDNRTYRMLKAATPGSYTFILQATKETPKRVWHPKTQTIGLRVPQHPVALAILEEIGEPLLSSTLILPDDDYALTDVWDIRDRLEHEVDLIIDGGYCGIDPSTVVDLSGETPEILRRGKGDVGLFGG